MRVLLFLIGSILLYGSQGEPVCRDEPYFLGGDKTRGCDWILKAHGCPQRDGDKVIGDEFCKVTCQRCEKSVEGTTLVTNRKCYDYGDEVVATFTNDKPRIDDWVAIYPASADSSNLGQAPFWVWLCGNQDEQCKVLYGSYSFGGTDSTFESGRDSWPLGPGTYKAILARRHHGGPYSSYVESDSFEIKAFPDKCKDVEDN